jgi:hypothetical protein
MSMRITMPAASVAEVQSGIRALVSDANAMRFNEVDQASFTVFESGLSVEKYRQEPEDVDAFLRRFQKVNLLYRQTLECKRHLESQTHLDRETRQHFMEQLDPILDRFKWVALCYERCLFDSQIAVQLISIDGQLTGLCQRARQLMDKYTDRLPIAHKDKDEVFQMIDGLRRSLNVVIEQEGRGLAGDRILAEGPNFNVSQTRMIDACQRALTKLLTELAIMRLQERSPSLSSPKFNSDEFSDTGTDIVVERHSKADVDSVLLREMENDSEGRERVRPILGDRTDVPDGASWDGRKEPILRQGSLGHASEAEFPQHAETRTRLRRWSL